MPMPQDNNDRERDTFHLLMAAYTTKALQKMMNDPKIDLKDEAVCFRLIDKKFTDAERDTIVLCLKHQLSPPVLNFNQYKQMHILKQSFFLTPLREGHYLLDPYFLNRYNNYLLDSKYPTLPENLPDSIEDIANQPFYIDEASVYEFLDTLYSMDDLKQICRDYHIKGFSNKRKDDINTLIVDTLMSESDQFINQLFNRYADFKQLIAAFIIRDTNIFEPTDHKARPFIVYQQDSEFVTIPKDVLSRFRTYFNQHQISSLKSLDKASKKAYAFMITQNNEFKVPKNAADAINTHKVIDVDEITKSQYLDFLQSRSNQDVYSDFLIHVHLKGLNSLEELEALINHMRVQDVHNRHK